MAQPEEMTNRQIVRMGLLAAAIALIIVFFGGIAATGYGALTAPQESALKASPDAPKAARDSSSPWSCDFLRALFAMSVGSAIVVGALVSAWRLMNRKTPRWGMAAVVLAVLLFGFLVWPTPWTYVEYGCSVWRVNRLFGTRDHEHRYPSCDAKPGEPRPADPKSSKPPAYNPDKASLPTTG